MTTRPYSSRALRALELAEANAARLENPAVGTEHILLGLLEEETGPAAQLLNHLGVTIEDVRTLWRETAGREL